MINIDGRLINPAHIVSAEIETTHYMNGSASWLVVRMIDGSQLRREHGVSFDAFKAHDAIARAALPKETT